MLAVLPNHLRQKILHTNVRGHVFGINEFSVIQLHVGNPKYDRYRISTWDWVIMIKENTVFVRLGDKVDNIFPRYPTLWSVNTLANDQSVEKKLIGMFTTILHLHMTRRIVLLNKRWFFLDVVGRIVWGKQTLAFYGYELYLQDET